jgi:hypothetical protein
MTFDATANDLRTPQKICEYTDSLCLLSLSSTSLKFYYFRLFQNEIFLFEDEAARRDAS